MKPGTGKRPAKDESLWEPRKVQRLLEMLKKDREAMPPPLTYSTRFSSDLPFEVLGLIFTYCHPFELMLPLVCQTWCRVWKGDPVIGLSNPEYVSNCARDLIALLKQVNGVEQGEMQRSVLLRDQALEAKDMKERAGRLEEWETQHDLIHNTTMPQTDKWNNLVGSIRASTRIDAWESVALTGNIRLLEYQKKKELDRMCMKGGQDFVLLCALVHDGTPKVTLTNTHGTVLFHAVQSGRVEAVQWVIDHTEEWFDTRSTRCAAERKDWEMLEFLSAQGAPCTAASTAVVAKEGNLELLKKLRTGINPAHWDSEVCVGGYVRGHNALVAWAVEHGCPLPTINNL